MLNDEKRYRLISKLNDRTRNGKLQWEDTAKVGVFQTSFPDYIVLLETRASEGSPESNDYGIRIVNNDGKTIEEFWDVDVNLPGRNSYNIMKPLYETARRQALGVEKAIDQILQQLEGDPLDDDVPF